jgi:magnesium transporter
MISYYHYTKNFETLGGPEDNCWVNVIAPDNSDLEFLNDSLNVPIEFINDISDIDERPRIDIDEEWSLIILRIPIQNFEVNGNFQTVPFGIIISEKYFVSLCNYDAPMIRDFITYCIRRRIKVENKIEFIYRLILSASVWYLKYLKIINNHINLVEKDIEKSIKNKELHKLLKIEKSLVYFFTSIKGNENVFYKLKNSKLTRGITIDDELLEDVYTELNQSLETTKIHSDILSGMMDAFASVISNNLNEIMKKLTSISIILMIPTLIASFYGMNVPNFFEKFDFAFVVVLIISFLISISVVYFFRKRKWF